MRGDAPPLLPIFRSRVQADLLTRLLLRPDQEYTLTELGQVLSVPVSTVYRESARLIAAEILSVRSVGRAKLVRANASYRLARPLTELLIGSFGPQIVIGEEFRDVRAVETLLIYGSWAARYLGEYGPSPRDIDVLVVGAPERSDVYDAADRAQQRLGITVNPTVSTRQRWANSSDALIRSIRHSPVLILVDVSSTQGSES